MPTNFVDLGAVYTGQSFRSVLGGDLRSARLIDALDSLLVGSAGWTRTSSTHPFGAVSYPFGAPTWNGVVGPLQPVFCIDRAPFLTINGTQYKFFNPGREIPISGGCVWFALDTTALGTLTNLATAISSGSLYLGGTTSSPLDLTITGVQPGPDLNFPVVIPDGEWGTGGIVDGGGWKWTSIAGYDVLAVGLHGGANPFDGWTVFTFTLNGEDIVGYKIDTAVVSSDPPIVQLTLIANPYGFAVFDPFDDTHRLANTSMLITSLYIPPAFTSVTPAIFALGGGSFRASTDWHNPRFDNVYSNGSIICLGGPPNRIAGSASGAGPYPRPMCLRSPGAVPLLTNAGVPISQGALIMMGATGADTSYVVGKMYDCMMVNDYLPGPIEMPNPSVPSEPLKYESISAQPGTANTTRSTLMWRYKDA